MKEGDFDAKSKKYCNYAFVTKPSFWIENNFILNNSTTDQYIWRTFWGTGGSAYREACLPAEEPISRPKQVWSSEVVHKSTLTVLCLIHWIVHQWCYWHQIKPPVVCRTRNIANALEKCTFKKALHSSATAVCNFSLWPFDFRPWPNFETTRSIFKCDTSSEPA